MTKGKFTINTNHILWAVYVGLLAVLLPHTAWAFEQFEPAGLFGTVVAWMGAFSFEAAIAVLTHKLAGHIERTPKKLQGKAKFAYRYLNAYAAGLVIALGVSVLANLAHAVEYGQSVKIFTAWQIPFGVYAVTFGAVLPLTSLLFARVLSNVVESEGEEDPMIAELRKVIAELRSKLQLAEQVVRSAQAEANESKLRAMAAEERLNGAAEFAARLFAEDKRQRILAAREQWPGLASSVIAVIASASPAYVSEVLNGEK